MKVESEGCLRRGVVSATPTPDADHTCPIGCMGWSSPRPTPWGSSVSPHFCVVGLSDLLLAVLAVVDPMEVDK